MTAIKAIYNGADFMPLQPIPVSEQYKVVITFLEPLEENTEREVKKRPRSEVIGLLSGKVWMADDFNEPIEEFKEYME